jgi:hypothetical protein
VSLSIQLDGKPVYLYKFLQGAYEDKRQYVCAHSERLTQAGVIERLKTVAAQLPEEIEIDFMCPDRQPDLFERALELAGFTTIEDEFEGVLWLRRAHPEVTERATLERALKDREDR